MEIDEDEEVEWYLLNCVAGLEIDLLRQCRAKMVEMPAEDVVKFVVPTMVKTRSHGANRMVSETKVKYLGYVFAKLRLCRATYTPIQKMDLCRSWMGTINIKGHKKLPPAPLPLSEEEIENFDLDNVIWEKDEQDETKAAKEKSGIIMDTVENDRQENEREREKEEAIEEVCRTVYKSLKVEDMVKVTAKNKFFDEDGIIRRLKEGMVFVRFFTYGTMFEEWLDPSDVRKLTETEIVDGLGGPAAPITQRDLDGPQDNERYNDDPRNTVGAFGGGPATRDRRQDRTERSFEKDRFDPKKERENWNQYKENEKRNEGGAYNDGNGVEFRAGSKTDFRAESDVDSQWGRNNQPQERQRGDRRTEQAGPSRGRQEDDWSSFVNTPTSKNKQTNSQTSKEETDDFFSSLMSDLSKDVDGNQGQRSGQGEGRRDQKPAESASQDSDDDFFASLMSDIEDEPSERTKSPPSTKKGNNADDDDDFFASLEREIKGSPSSNKSEPTAGSSSGSTNSASSVDEDDFFASLEMELASDLGDVKKVASADSKKEVKTSFATDNSAAAAAVEEDDFFSNLEAELQSDLDGGENENDEQIATPQTIKDDDAQVPVEKSFTTRDEKENNVPSIKSAFDAATLKKQTVPQLKEILRDRGLKLSGKKAELIERINSSA
jgi:transcription antitermination factor NusG